MYSIMFIMHGNEIFGYHLANIILKDGTCFKNNFDIWLRFEFPKGNITNAKRMLESVLKKKSKISNIFRFEGNQLVCDGKQLSLLIGSPSLFDKFRDLIINHSNINCGELIDETSDDGLHFKYELIKDGLNFIEKNSWLFEPGKQHEAIQAIKEICSRANYSIEIYDPYSIDSEKSIYDIISSFSQKNKLRILTYDKISNAKLKASEHNIDIRKSNESHDRFIIIDRKDVYKFGGTIKDAGLNQYSDVYKISDEFLKNKWLSIWDNLWEKAISNR